MVAEIAQMSGEKWLSDGLLPQTTALPLWAYA